MSACPHTDNPDKCACGPGCGCPDRVVDRIAVVLADCYRDGIEIAHAPTAARHAAERVAAELQLKEERACDCSPYPNRGPGATPCNCGDSTARQRRWVMPYEEAKG